MNIDAIPIWLLFLLVFAIVTLSIKLGQFLGIRSCTKSKQEKETSVSAIAGSVLGLVAFMLAFTFSIVSSRYDARKHLVIDEANQIGTLFIRSDFLPEPDRTPTRALLNEYTTQRLAAVKRMRNNGMDKAQIAVELEKSEQIQKKLWKIAVDNAVKNPESEIISLYVDSLNTLIDIHTERVAIGLQARVPAGIWFTLISLIFLGMVAVGYQMGIAGSKRSVVQILLAISFSLVICLIAMLDRPHSSALQVSQQPFEDLLKSME